MREDILIDAATLADKRETADFMEFVTNGELINWRYWAEQMPHWSASEAARLLNGLDPDLFADLSSPPVPCNNTSKETSSARQAERLARAQGIDSKTPDEWFVWACEHSLKVHLGMRVALHEKWMKVQAERSSETSAETPKFHDSIDDHVELIPGKPPKIAVGKLAVCAAWEIEQATKRRATDKQVMERLQKWADDGAKPETLRRSEKAKRAVVWVTTKSVDKEYTIEACQQTLKTWWLSRE